MKKLLLLGLGTILGFKLICGGIAAAEEGEKSSPVKDVKTLPHQELTEARPSTNGFTCIPTVMNRPDPDPMCMDGAVHQWMTDLINHAPKPTNTGPGIAYMAWGGSHFEKDGKVVMSGDGEPGHP